MIRILQTVVENVIFFQSFKYVETIGEKKVLIHHAFMFESPII